MSVKRNATVPVGNEVEPGAVAGSGMPLCMALAAFGAAALVSAALPASEDGVTHVSNEKRSRNEQCRSF